MNKRIVSLLKTASQVLVGAVMQGHLLASKEELIKRLVICGDCEHFEEVNSGCQKCGCRVIYKARLKEARCPINKW